jgi:hypothetical protein
MNVKFRKLGSLEWRWLGLFITPTTILVVVVDGTPDSPMVHRTGHCSVSGACHVSCPLGFGAVDHWRPLSSSCTGQSGGTPDMSGASWHCCSDFWPRIVHFCILPLRAGDHCSVGSPDTVRCTPDSPVNYSGAPLWKPESGQFIGALT